MNFNEKEILAQLRDPKKQRKAFEEIVRTFSEKLYWQIRNIVIVHDDADDVLQNTLIKAWTNIGAFRGESKLSTWLYKIAYNESLTFLAHKKATVSIDDGDASTAARMEGDSYMDGDETMALLTKAIESLPEKQRAVFNMKYYQEMKYEEISEITGTSVGALKASYHIAVKKIEEFFHSHD